MPNDWMTGVEPRSGTTSKCMHWLASVFLFPHYHLLTDAPVRVPRLRGSPPEASAPGFTAWSVPRPLAEASLQLPPKDGTLTQIIPSHQAFNHLCSLPHRDYVPLCRHIVALELSSPGCGGGSGEAFAPPMMLQQVVSKSGARRVGERVARSHSGSQTSAFCVLSSVPGPDYSEIHSFLREQRHGSPPLRHVASSLRPCALAPLR